MRTARPLKDKDKKRIISYLEVAAPKYKKYYLGRSFNIICDDFCEYNVVFTKNKFLHLTGLKIKGNEEDFFKNCLTGKISIEQINNIQKYNLNTIYKKCKRLSKFDSFLYASTSTTLFLENLHTNTFNFPVAINNVELDTCICFNDDILTASSLRTSSNSYNADKSKKIICILSKKYEEEKYSQINYISSSKEIISNIEGIKERIHIDLLKRIIT